MVTEVNKGYVKYEVGEFPEDWNVILIGDSLKFKNGLNKESEYFGYGTPIVNYMDVFNNHGIRQKNIEGKVFLNREEKNSFSAQKGDVFFTRTSETQEEIGTSAVLLESVEDCVFSGFILRGRPKNDIVAPEYYQYCLIPKYVRTQIISTSSYTTRALTNGRYLSKVTLVIPPTLTEQKAIATALSDVDGLITSLEQTITKKKAIKQGAMQQLLTPSTDWRKHKLGDTLDFVVDNRGKTPPIQADGYPMVEVNAIYKQGKSPNLQRVTKFVSKETYENWFRDGHPLKGDILIVTVGSAGYTSYVNDREFCIAQNLISLRIKPSYSSEFIFYLTKTDKFKRLVSSVLMGAVQPSLKVPHLNNFEFEFPELDSQKAIAQILSDMDAEITQLETKKEKYQAIKQGMMQELITGKTRLI